MTSPTVAFEDVAAKVWDAIVLGAGPAGALAARQLAIGGARVLLVDRKSFPRRKVCGACLNKTALGVLESMGLGSLPARLGGIELESLELAFAGRSTRLVLPGGIALSRPLLDDALVETAIAEGVDFLPETQGLDRRALAGKTRGASGSRQPQLDRRGTRGAGRYGVGGSSVRE